jgi:putative aldouronate transport system substrate-binding protein
MSWLMGCTAKDGGKSTAGETQTEAAEALPYKDTFEFSILGAQHPHMGENMRLLEEVQKKLNAKITFFLVPSSNFQEKLNITLASGDLPELVYLRDNAQLTQWTEQGATIPLDGLIQKHGKDILTTMTKEDITNIKSPADGKQYSVPGLYELQEAFSTVIRQDWLEKLNLKTPVTLEEWEKVLTEFKEKDPAGNGTTVPWAGPLDAFYNILGIKRAAHTYNVDRNDAKFTVTDDGKYVPYYYHPRYKEFLVTVNRWYENKLIDQEFIVRNKDTKSWHELFHNGKAGAGQGWANTFQLTTVSLKKLVPEGIYKPVPPIKGPYGDQIIAGRGRFNGRAVITVTAEKKGKSEDVMKYVNWCFSPEGSEFWNFGIEGLHFNRVDGKPVLLEPYNQGWEKARKEGINPVNFVFNWTKDAYAQNLLAGKKPEELDETARITYDGLYLNTEYIYNELPKFSSKLVSELAPAVFPLLNELEAKAIMGVISIDDFFNELEKVKKDGLDKIANEMNDMYQKVK